jgi:hypothetical protein
LLCIYRKQTVGPKTILEIKWFGKYVYLQTGAEFQSFHFVRYISAFEKLVELAVLQALG